MKVRLHRRARSDLEAIRSYLLKHAGVQAAERVKEHLRTKIARLAHRPLIGTATDDPDIRILPPTKYPYRIYYTVTDSAVIVLHIRHTAQRAPTDVGVP
jgi:plasmid stabilization system protein ParE